MRKVFAWLGAAMLFVSMSRAEAANDVLKPYVVLILDTSGSMGAPTGSGPTSCGKRDTRINHAVCAINNIVNSYGEMVFSLGRFREVTNGKGATNAEIGTPGSQVCDANGDQEGNVSRTLPNPSGGDNCNTQGPYCGDCDPSTGTTKACTNNSQCTTTCNLGTGFCNAGTTFGCENGVQQNNGTFNDSAYEVLTPLVDGNNNEAARFTDGACNACSVASNVLPINPEIWGVSQSTFTPLSAALAGARLYWRGIPTSTDANAASIWPATSPGYDPINRDPSAAVFLPANGAASCNPAANCVVVPNCVGTSCCCASQCRPYITILLTDGAETCTTATNTQTAASNLLTVTPRNDFMLVTTLTRTGNVVTLETAVAHPFKVGDQIFVQGTVGAPFTGTFTVTGTPLTTSLTYTTATSGNITTITNSGGTGFANVRHTASLNRYTILTKPIGFGIAPGNQAIEDIAHAGGAADVPGVNEGYYAQDEADLELAISRILADSVRAEICNDKDDDCDTRIDEDFPTKGNACTNGQVGQCLRTGTLVCSNGGLACTVTTVPPGVEGPGCNGLDDDCDGFIDENLGCTQCVPIAEICDGVDQSCDGVPDRTCVCAGGTRNGQPCHPATGNVDCTGGGTCPVATACTPITRQCGTGVCSGTETCSFGTPPSNYTGCTAQVATNEQCDGLDNDCDGVCDGFAQDCSEQVAPCTQALTSCPATDSLGDASKNPIAQNICHPGSRACPQKANCQAGNTFGSCLGEVKACGPDLGPGMGCDTCNGLDDDCDNVVDEGFVGADCSTNCGIGTTICQNGTITCNSVPAAGDATCNNIDDDCDGKVDENWVCTTGTCVGGTSAGTACAASGKCVGGTNPGTVCQAGSATCTGGGTCSAIVCAGNGTCTGACTGPDCCSCGSGTTCEVNTCINGALSCVVDPAITPETCNCLDDDCDGLTDETSTANPICVGGGTCVPGTCQCAFGCAAGEFPCPEGKKCEATAQGAFCVNDPCFGFPCPAVTVSGSLHVQTCVPKPLRPNEAQCVDTCSLINDADNTQPFPQCPSTQVCVDSKGECLPNNCTTFGCAANQSCVNGTCVSNPCQGVTCDTGKYCLGGECIASCSDVTCSSGQRCREGACETDPCGHTCPFGQACNDTTGQCIEDPCKFRDCPSGQWCNPNDGQCEDDPCVTSNITCPGAADVCRGGTCVNPNDDVTIDGGGVHVTVGGGGCNTGGGNGGFLLALGVMGVLLSRRRRTVGGAL